MKSKSLLRRIISNPLIQALVIYVSGAWVIIELIEYFIEHFNVNEKVRIILLIILLCGLPIALFIAWYVSREKETDRAATDDKPGMFSLTEENKPSGRIASLFRKPMIILPSTVIILLLIVAGIRYFNRQAKISWANEKALPEIEKLNDELDFHAAFGLLQKAGKYISDNPDFQELASVVSIKSTMLTDPPEADIYIRKYADMGGEWQKLGKTSIDSIWLPNFAFNLVKIEKPGYENVLAIAPTREDTFFRKLFPVGKIPPGMVYVEGYQNEVTGNFYDEKNGFFIDRYEVPNKQFKKFIDDGGYKDPVFWQHPFIKEGKVLSHKEAMAEFTDRSGRPGPATWEASDYPNEQGEYPVSGVSWYEAAAYAEYAGKSLPTSNHWSSAAGFYSNNIWLLFASRILQLSNFQGNGPGPAGKMPGVGCFGTYDMAGNVREWCWNATQDGHIIRGGAWDDVTYMYSYRSQLPAFDRSPKNGFRCVQYIEKEKIPTEAFQQIEFHEDRDYYREVPVSDDIFSIYKEQFQYDSIALEASIERRDENHDDWILEKVTFKAAYGNEKVIAYLFLPRNTPPPFQTIIFFPGSYSRMEEVLETSIGTKWFLDYLPKNGRAVMYPVYKGTYERIGDQKVVWGETHQYTNWLIKWTQDFSRSIDYLETRPDIDTGKIGYYGHSWGGNMGGLIPAVEDRLNVSIMITGGFGGKARPEADMINYVPRITIPVLMLNGKYDMGRPFHTSVKPFYDLLGTPEKDKYLYVYKTDHFVPKSEMIKETLNFLDQYFGPVK